MEKSTSQKLIGLYFSIEDVKYSQHLPHIVNKINSIWMLFVIILLIWQHRNGVDL